MSIEVDEFATRFEKEFPLVTCLSSLTYSSVQYIDSGASCHMIRLQEISTSLAKRDLDLDIELGDNSNYMVVDLGIVAF